MTFRLRALWLVEAALTLTLISPSSALVIEGFESTPVGQAPPSGFTQQGHAVTVQDGSGFTGGAAITATEGTRFAYLTTGPMENGSAPSPFDRNGDGRVENDWSQLLYTFTASAGDVLAFDFDVLTDEISGGVTDIFAIVLDGSFVATGSIGAPSGSFPAVTTFATGPITGPDGSAFFDGRLGWTTITRTLTSTGTHTLEFYVADEEDFEADTALLVDNLRFVPEPDLLALLALGGLAVVRARAGGGLGGRATRAR